jgi:ornithine--oxo-acid transaminase
LVIDDSDRQWMVQAFDDVIAECHKVPGSIWDLGKSLAGHAMAGGR